MKLDRIIKGLEIESINGDCGIEIESVCFDSRECVDGSLFVAVDGTQADGHLYIDNAIARGARAVIYENEKYAPVNHLYEVNRADECDGAGRSGESEVTAIHVSDSRRALALAAACFYGNPSSKLRLVGITGTNGKTTTATLLYNLFTALGYCCGLISTIANYVGKEKSPADHTTPDPVSLNRLLAQMVDKGCEYCFMEVSSHSLAQERVAGISFKGAIFSNLTRDHLDYHKTFAEYLRCKKLLFDNLGKGSFSLVNTDDKNGLVMVQNTASEIHTYACRRMADFNCRIIEETMDGMLLEIDGTQMWSRFIGTHNGYNLLAVYATAMLLGADKEQVLTAMSSLGPVAGRLEYIRGGKDLTAVVDYSHTPDALENALKTLRETCRDRCLICVFGCGGDRDRGKRPQMGVIATKYADKVFVTSDNPRHENPESIIEEIRGGMDARMRAKSLFICDRREAVRTAVLTAPEGAVILVAGKGHEDYQIIGDVKHHFDDREVIRDTFTEMEQI